MTTTEKKLNDVLFELGEISRTMPMWDEVRTLVYVAIVVLGEAKSAARRTGEPDEQC